MICILSMSGPDITGWIIATDVDDARRQVPVGDEYQGLAQLLYTMYAPPPGKHLLPTGHVMLVT